MALLLLAFLQANGVSSGQAFKSCLNSTSYETKNNLYQLLLNYPFRNEVNITNGDSLRLHYNDSLNSLTPQRDDFATFWCSRFNSEIFCVRFLHIPYPHCEGMVGDSLITTNITRGECEKYGITIKQADDYLSSLPVNDFIGLEDGYVYSHCAVRKSYGDFCYHNGERAQGCYWENGGWTCSYYEGGYWNIENYCYLQWPPLFWCQRPWK